MNIYHLIFILNYIITYHKRMEQLYSLLNNQGLNHTFEGHCKKR